MCNKLTSVDYRAFTLWPWWVYIWTLPHAHLLLAASREKIWSTYSLHIDVKWQTVGWWQSQCAVCVCVWEREQRRQREIFWEVCVCVYLCVDVCRDTCLVLSGCVCPLWLLCKLEYSPAVKSLRFHLASWPSPLSSTSSYSLSHLSLSSSTLTFVLCFLSRFLTLSSWAVWIRPCLWGSANKPRHHANGDALQQPLSCS